jgi:hypothetical protein
MKQGVKCASHIMVVYFTCRKLRYYFRGYLMSFETLHIPRFTSCY